MKKLSVILVSLIVAFFVSGCAPGDPQDLPDQPAPAPTDEF